MSGTTPPSEDELIDRWTLVVGGIARSQQRIFERVERGGVPAQWFAVLHALLVADQHRLPMSTLARDLSMTTGGFTKLADRIAREGLIDRRGSSGDRRVVYAALTDKGLALARDSDADFRAGVREFVVDVIGAGQVGTLAEIAQLLDAAHAARDADADLVQTERDPALPDRRGRGHEAV